MNTSLNQLQKEDSGANEKEKKNGQQDIKAYT